MLDQARCIVCPDGGDLVLWSSGDPSPLSAQPHLFSCTAPAAWRHQLYRCRGCGLVLANPRLPSQDLTRLYREMEDPDYVTETPWRRMTADRVMARLETYLSPGRLLDAGCFTGVLLEAAQDRGWETVGVEPSHWAAAIAEKNKLTVLNCTLEEAGLPDGSFDAIVLADVIEHVVAPNETLKVVHRLLKPGGVLWMTTPNVESLLARVMGRRWYGFSLAHLYYFSPRSLSLLLARSGMEPRDLSTYGRWFTLEYWLSRASCYGPLFSLPAWLLARLGGGQRPIYLDLRDQMQVFARKHA